MKSSSCTAVGRALHSAGGPAIGGAKKRCKTLGFEKGVATNHFKTPSFKKVLGLTVSGQGKLELSRAFQKCM